MSVTKPYNSRRGASCEDCGVETYPSEYYMVKDKIWDKAVPEDVDENRYIYLCIGCLEGRLGYSLTSKDFIKFPINNINSYTSDRLIDRLLSK